MKPYLAVIVDSFHSALASRILWVAFIAIWIFLIAIAPIGYREDYTTQFRWFDLENGTQMKAMLARGLVDPNERESALGRLARAFPDKLQRSLRQVAEGDDVRIDKGSLAEALNEFIEDESPWYDAEAWKTTVRLRELRELDEIPDEEIAEPQRRRRARLRIEAALPGVFAAQSAQMITLQYAGFDFPAVFAIGKEQFKTLVNQIVVPVLMNWLLGFALVFLGILVTASIIPDMLQPGSLHLLLSKPLSRTKLLLAKYMGGCAFVLLCVSQIVIGLWLIAGFRLDLWNARVLWCIPVLVFLFSVFYSVSILAGLQWRSPVLSIGITCMFGAFVVVLGFIAGNFDRQVTAPDKLGRIAFVDGDVIATTLGRGIKRFDRESNEWVEVMEGVRRFDLIVPPVVTGDGELVSARIRNGRFNLYGTGSLDLLFHRGENGYKPEPSVLLPIGTKRLYRVDESLIALNNMGLMMADLPAIQKTMSPDEDAQETDEEPDNEVATVNPTFGVTAWVSDLLRMQGGATEDFQAISPRGMSFSDPVRVSMLPGRKCLVYSYGRLVRLSLPPLASEGEQALAEIEAELQLEGEGAARVAMAASGDTVLVARRDEPVRWIDATTLEVKHETSPPSDLAVNSVTALGDSGRFAIVTVDGRCHVADAAQDDIRFQLLSPREVTSVSYDEAGNRLAVAHHIDRVDFFDATSMESFAGGVVERIRPTLKSWRAVDRYGITPLRTLTPQTVELGDTMAALVSGESSFAFGDAGNEDEEVIQLRVARPVLSCAAFIVVMLGISCVYFSRRDF